MANITLGYPNRIDGSTLSGGSWLTSLPLTQLQTRVYSEVARSTNLLAASTQFQIDIGAVEPISLVSLINNNFSNAGTYRVRASNTAGVFTSPLYDSGTVVAYPPMPFGTYSWDDAEFWSGTISAERLTFYPHNTTLTFTPVAARYWLIEIFDTTNSAGYFQLGRVMISGTFTPAHNAAYGFEWDNDASTQVGESLGGVEFFDERPVYRVVKFSVDFLADNEVFGSCFDMIRRSNMSREVYFIYNTDDTLYTLQRSFPGRLRSLPTFTVDTPTTDGGKFEIKELI